RGVTTSASLNQIDRFLNIIVKRGGSDLHLAVGSPPIIRIDGELERIRYRNLSEGDFYNMISAITPPDVWAKYQLMGDADFAYQNDKAIFAQREIGPDVIDFVSGVRSALREDPDVLLVGEMRDLETIRMALTAAETGLLVFATLHTNSAPKAVDRIIDAFPASEQEQIRVVLAESLRAVVAQQLLKRTESGRIPAFEILLGSPGTHR